MRHIMTIMAKPSLDRLGASVDDPVLGRADGSPASLNDLLADIDQVGMNACAHGWIALTDNHPAHRRPRSVYGKGGFTHSGG